MCDLFSRDHRSHDHMIYYVCRQSMDVTCSQIPTTFPFPSPYYHHFYTNMSLWSLKLFLHPRNISGLFSMTRCRVNWADIGPASQTKKKYLCSKGKSEIDVLHYPTLTKHYLLCLAMPSRKRQSPPTRKKSRFAVIDGLKCIRNKTQIMMARNA